MVFNPTDYIAPGESTILTGTVKRSYNSPLDNLILTNKTLILARTDIITIIPLNKISAIYGGAEKLIINTDGTYTVEFYYKGNPSWYNEIIKEISKRIG